MQILNKEQFSVDQEISNLPKFMNVCYPPLGIMHHQHQKTQAPTAATGHALSQLTSALPLNMGSICLWRS